MVGGGWCGANSMSIVYTPSLTEEGWCGVVGGGRGGRRARPGLTGVNGGGGGGYGGDGALLL